jgi:hypothetical protein
LLIYWAESYYKEKHKLILVAIKETGLEVNAEKLSLCSMAGYLAPGACKDNGCP